jgi:hypothetical protein
LIYIEGRMMKSEIKIHETMRQIKMVLDVYDHKRCGLKWFANILHRELSSFEMAERKRLSYSIKLSLIDYEDVLTLMFDKVQLIVLGAMTLSLEELEHFDKLEDGIEKEYKKKDMMRLKTNMNYLVEIVIPHGLKMSGMLKGLTVDSSTSTLSRYLAIADDIKVVEQWIVHPFNDEDNVGALVEWDNETLQYKLKSTSTSSVVFETERTSPRSD